MDGREDRRRKSPKDSHTGQNRHYEDTRVARKHGKSTLPRQDGRQSFDEEIQISQRKLDLPRFPVRTYARVRGKTTFIPEMIYRWALWLMDYKKRRRPLSCLCV